MHAIRPPTPLLTRTGTRTQVTQGHEQGRLTGRNHHKDTNTTLNEDKDVYLDVIIIEDKLFIIALTKKKCCGFQVRQYKNGHK